MQCERCVHGKAKPVDALTCASNLIREKGILRLWRGVSATFTGCVPGACSCIGFIRSNSFVCLTWWSSARCVLQYFRVHEDDDGG
jgi:hypothetical protein